MSFDEPLHKDAVAGYFSGVAATYSQNNYFLAGKRGKYPDIFRRHRYILQMTEGLRGRALEVGCGSGEMLCDLVQRGFAVVGADLASGMLAASRARGAERRLKSPMALVQTDIEHLPFRERSFDLVVAAGVIEYLTEDEKALRALHRVLKPGGILIVSVRNLANLSRPLVTARDLLRSAGIGKAIIDRLSEAVPRLLAVQSNLGIPARRHAPWRLKRLLEQLGFEPTDQVFYHFAVLPRLLERRWPAICRWEEKLECLSRTPLGYLANQYVVKARKVA
jgi:ubiquinone/menaquinone biosynthesis C-methylase UbiE